MKYTTDLHTDIDDNKIMLRNYSKLLSYESDKTFIHVKFEKTLLDSKIIPFTYFTTETTSLYNPYILSEGDIFTPINNKNYYYIIQDNQPSRIPDTQTLEVLLNQRNSSIEDIKLLEDSEFIDVLLYSNGSKVTPTQMVLPSGIKINAETQKKLAAGGGGGGGGGSTPEIQSKIDEWSPDMKLTSIAEEFAALAATASSADALLNSSIDQMQGVVDMAIADAEASKEQAKASQAQAEAAIAQANAAQAEAEAQKAEYESKNTE